MIYIKYVVFAVISLLIDIPSRFIFNWIVVLFADKDGNLPKYLYWFQTFDATLDEGRNARRTEIANNWGNNWDTYNPDPKTWFEIYKNRAFWLFRNSTYGFSYYLLGMDIDYDNWEVKKYVETDREVIFYAVAKDGKGFNFRYAGKYGTYKLGWKSYNTYDKTNGKFGKRFGPLDRIPCVISVNPFNRKK